MTSRGSHRCSRRHWLLPGVAKDAPRVELAAERWPEETPLDQDGRRSAAGPADVPRRGDPLPDERPAVGAPGTGRLVGERAGAGISILTSIVAGHPPVIRIRLVDAAFGLNGTRSNARSSPMPISAPCWSPFPERRPTHCGPPASGRRGIRGTRHPHPRLRRALSAATGRASGSPIRPSTPPRAPIAGPPRAMKPGW